MLCQSYIDLASCDHPDLTSTPQVVKELISEDGAIAGFAEPGETLTYRIRLTNSGNTAVTYLASEITENPYPAIFGAPEVLDNSKVLLAGVAAGGTITTTIFEPALQQALNGDGTVDDLFTEASRQVQAELDK